VLYLVNTADVISDISTSFKGRQTSWGLKNSISSDGMEGAGVFNIFNRSLHTRGVCYTKYLGDGDSKSYERVAAGKPCGPNIAVQNLQDMYRKEMEQDGGDLCKKREEQGCMTADL
jgi:hypothetical protein